MHKPKTWLRLFTLLFAPLPFLLPCTAFAVDLRVNDLLDRIEAAREEPSQVHYTVRTTVLTEYGEHPEERMRSEKLLDFVVDRERLAAAWTLTWWKGLGEPEPRATFYQRIWEGERGLTFHADRTGPAEGIWSGDTKITALEPLAVRAFETGAELLGIYQGDFRPYYDIVRGARDLNVKMDEKTFPGAPTYRIEATTERGHYTIWVDESLDYHFRKAIVRRSADDVIWQSQKLSELRHEPKESLEYVITNDSFDEIGGLLIPTRGSVIIKTVFYGYGPGKSRSSTSTWDIHLEHISFTPDIEELDVFSVKAPDGTPVISFDEEGRGSWNAVWTGEGLVFDEALAMEARSAQEAVLRARGAYTKLPDIYDEDADGRALLAAALADAKKDDKRVFIVWGANWCTPCRLLERFFDRSPDIISILESSYVVVHMDIGRNDKNLELGQEFGLDITDFSIPQATILDGTGAKVVHTGMAALVVPGNGGRFVHSSDLWVRFLESSTP